MNEKRTPPTARKTHSMTVILLATRSPAASSRLDERMKIRSAIVAGGMAHGHSDIGRLLEDVAYTRATAESLQALATPSRLRILARLHAGPASVGELATAVGLEASAVSHQLRLLRHLGLVI